MNFFRPSSPRTSFIRLFARVVLRHPQRALAALFWQITRRRVRAWNRLVAGAAGSRYAYDVWIAQTEREDASGPFALPIEPSDPKLSFSILIVADEKRALHRTLDSISAQTYQAWDIAIVAPLAEETPGSFQSDADPVWRHFPKLRDAVAQSTGHWIVPVRAGSVLAASALSRFAAAASTHPRPVAVYGDEDRMTELGARAKPWLKPQWNQELFLAQDYIAGSCAIESAALRTAAAANPSFESLEALLLAVLFRTQREVRHVCAVTTHHPASRPAPALDMRLAAARSLLDVEGAQAEPGPFNSIRVRWPLSAQPLVSIIVPTRDGAALLRRSCEGVLHRTRYAAIELLVVDNGSVEPETHALFDELARDLRVRMLSWPYVFNYAAINNFAASQARGEWLCLLNNDTEVLTSDWLEELMRHAIRPEVGAAGARLLYEDGTIQHAGVVIGLGQAAGHAHRHLASEEYGYFARTHVPHYVSAVTGACLVVEKAKFDAVGGFDAEGLAIAFNDVDLCLKLQARGWKNIYVPQATLVHHESKTRTHDLSPLNAERYLRELAILQLRWNTIDFHDPLHHPGLDRSGEDYVLGL